MIICANCNKQNALFRCSACKCVNYCNEKCQANDWKKHKLTCFTSSLVNIVLVSGINSTLKTIKTRLKCVLQNTWRPRLSWFVKGKTVKEILKAF
jgi:hypothetical protein